MHITILTLFPEMFAGSFSHSIIKRAQKQKLLDIKLLNIRDFATDKHKTVDDHPYGGGQGMILRVDIIDRALKYTLNRGYPSKRQTPQEKTRIILLDPQGKVFTQKKAIKLSKFDHLILICGHYEGVDERVRKLVDEEISIGDYILTGGEIPAMVVIDSIARLLPGVLAKEEATRLESFSPYAIRHKPYAILEYPQYTRPPVYQKLKVPSILLSGDHGRIAEWRKDQAIKRTKIRRPDLFTQKG